MSKIIIKFEGGIQVETESFEDAKKFIDHYGKPSRIKKQEALPEPEGSEEGAEGLPMGASRDLVLLNKFIDVYPQGLASKELFMRLSANRKSLKKALEVWAKRIGLWTSNFEGTFFKGVYNGQRGFRLQKEAYDVGKDTLKHST